MVKIMKDKAYIVNKLKEKTKKSEEECNIIYTVLERHFIIGRHNQQKIKQDLVNELDVSLKEADQLYNILAEIVIRS